MATVYLETSIISILAARPSRDVVVRGRQRVTSDWWALRRPAFEVVTSQLVHDEALQGDPRAAQRRTAVLAGIHVLAIDDACADLGDRLLRAAAVPPKARVDALHIAVATLHRVDYLLTWNLKHIANVETRRKIEAACRAAGHEPPNLCTPDELMGDFGYGR